MLTLCYVDHHDDAYDWALRHRLDTHPKTGATQLIELRDTVKQEVAGPFYSRPARNKEELERALDFPWEKWTLDPAQRGDKEQAIMDFLHCRVFDPILRICCGVRTLRRGSGTQSTEWSSMTLRG